MSALAKPRIALTMGDPGGVGPELCLEVLAAPECGREWLPVVVADSRVLDAVAAHCPQRPASGLQAATVLTLEQYDQYAQSDNLPDAPVVLDRRIVQLSRSQCPFQPGVVSAETGLAAYDCFATAIDMAKRGLVDAITTGPIHKEALQAAGVRLPGHTEILAEAVGMERYCMMLTSELITCSFVTTHVGYRDVPDLLTCERIVQVGELTIKAMRELRGRPPRLVVCGLNPHSGEHGLFGAGEEERIILPAVETLRSKGADIVGPLAPDTAFLRERRAVTDAYVCMYHDQGHIPLKALAFEEAVNVTLGLPILRTSVDHGTALDIAWQGVAKPTSFIEATRLAARLSRGRRQELWPAAE